MQFRIHFEEKIHRNLYEDYCRFLFERVQRDIRNLINPKKYKVREKYVIESRVMKWFIVPKTIDLVYYVENCLEMVKVKGEYVIRVRKKWRVYGSRTSVGTLIRMLEYGTEKMPAYPVVSRVLRYYSSVYSTLLTEFIEERMLR